MKLQNLSHILIGILCIGLLPRTQAVVPPPDGGYPNFNTAGGQNALFSLTTGAGNTAVGWSSLFSATGGSFNTAVGAGALVLNTADNNTAMGAGALLLNTIGERNTAVGALALSSNTEGLGNTASGASALTSNTTGISNTAIGSLALGSNTTGQQNTAVGLQALRENTTGGNNTALGRNAGSVITGSGNICIGAFVDGVDGESGTTRIRNIGSTAIVGGIAVVIDGTGGIGDQRLGFASSSRRYKEDIKPMDKASETLFALKPVTFRAKGTMNPNRAKHYGLIAEDVAAVDSDLVVRNPEGKPQTVRYEAVNAMLLNEFLKEHRTVQEQGATITGQRKDFDAAIAQQQKQIEALAATVKEQASQIQKVSAQLELSKLAPQTVKNDD
jgi:hypothetical protein